MALPAVLSRGEDIGESLAPTRQEAPRHEARRQPRAGEAPLAPGVVLVADDDDALRETVAEILTIEGYRVLQAEDGLEALEVIRDDDVDVLVLDLAMPRLDGLSLLTRLGIRGPKVILYSAFEFFTLEQLDQMGVRDSVFRMLRKPVPPPMLLTAVAEALGEQ